MSSKGDGSVLCFIYLHTHNELMGLLSQEHKFIRYKKLSLVLYNLHNTYQVQ